MNLDEDTNTTRRTPRRFVLASGITVLAVMVGLVLWSAYSRLSNQVGAEDPADRSVTNTVATPEDVATPPPGSTGETEDEPDAPETDPHDVSQGGSQDDDDGRHPAMDVVRSFAHDFANPHPSHQKWRDRLRPWVTPSLATAYQTTRLRTVPDTSDYVVRSESIGEYAVTAQIEYRRIVTLWVLVEPGGDGWRVTRAEPMIPSK